ncbi:hypothetical protein BDV25DRAFT_137818 [Aspergillus avenaceus]|uniref:Uncharacterized protein n=1 Tax=Aspergillus avenaceus TaxID=36643 RepID=A0A5N6U1V1_ASPAV|nr:hypothetical protein BDV25DRAFT_137818 [Aspergillus avenaceus]
MNYTAYIISESGLPRDHHYLFIETHEAGPQTGHVYHVKGNIQQGMTFEHRTFGVPEEQFGFCGREKLGLVQAAAYERVLGLCERVEVPKKQFDGPKRLYPGEKLRRCQEWAGDAVALLREEGVLE